MKFYTVMKTKAPCLQGWGGRRPMGGKRRTSIMLSTIKINLKNIWVNLPNIQLS